MNGFEIISEGNAPLIALALRSGHEVGRDIVPKLVDPRLPSKFAESLPLRWTYLAPHRVIATSSRLEVDFDRSEPRSTLRSGESVWRSALTRDEVRRARRMHQSFYAAADGLIRDVSREWGSVLVLDLRSVEVSTASADIELFASTPPSSRWEDAVLEFRDSLNLVKPGRRSLDVQFEPRPRSGHFVAWLKRTHPECAYLTVTVRNPLHADRIGGLEALAPIDSALEIATARMLRVVRHQPPLAS